MLLNVDVKSLEVFTAAYLSQDKVMMQELIDGADMHKSNQILFKLPGYKDAEQGIVTPESKHGRLVAKTFKFRTLYGGSAYSFANDPDFASVSKSDKYWQEIIDKYYEKYKGLKQWHDSLLDTVIRTGKLIMPTGRVYKFERYETKYGDYKWPITNIKNYPVQGTGSDLVAIYRVSLYNRIKRKGFNCKLLATVHDSVLIDSIEDEIPELIYLANEVAQDVPKNFNKLFGVEYNLPFLVECEVGNDYSNMESYK